MFFFNPHQCSVFKERRASLFHVLVEFGESQKVVSKRGKLIKDAFGIVKQFTSIFSSTECVYNCLPKLNHAKYLEHAFFPWENAPTWRGPTSYYYSLEECCIKLLVSAYLLVEHT